MGGGLTDEIGINDREAGRALAAYVITEVARRPSLARPTVRLLRSVRWAMRLGWRSRSEEDGLITKEFVPNAQLGPPPQQATAIMQRNPEGTFDWLYAGFDFMMSSLVRAADRAGRTELKGIS